MKLSEQQQEFSFDVSRLIFWLYKNGYTVSMGEAHRTAEQALIYYNNGKGIIHSLHCKRLAIDLNLFRDGEYLTSVKDYMPAGEYWESLHPLNRWGGTFKSRPDADHFERQEKK